jgi:hypothetical protein
MDWHFKFQAWDTFAPSVGDDARAVSADKAIHRCETASGGIPIAGV